MIHQQQPLKKILIPKIHRVYVLDTRTKTILAFHQCARSLFYPNLIARHRRRMFRYKVILIELQLFALFQRAFSTTISTKNFANSIVLTKSCTIPFDKVLY